MSGYRAKSGPHVTEIVTMSDGQRSIIVHSDPQFLYDLGKIAAAERDALQSLVNDLAECGRAAWPQAQGARLVRLDADLLARLDAAAKDNQ